MTHETEQAASPSARGVPASDHPAMTRIWSSASIRYGKTAESAPTEQTASLLARLTNVAAAEQDNYKPYMLR